MDSNQIRNSFLSFFKERGHKEIPSSSLIIPDDPSVLFTTAGMQQFKKYFAGELDAEKIFGTKNAVSIQKCFRTSDIDEVGDDSHLTFFEMLGNFSFGGYSKKEAIGYAHEFITEELGLKIDFVSVFKGDEEVPADEESEKIWKSLGVKSVKKFGCEDNFWGPTGSEGPCGPTTEIYVKMAGGESMEIWNIVFTEYYRYSNGNLKKMGTLGIDTGMGMERVTAITQNKKNIFETDVFKEISDKINEFVPEADEKIKRVLMDHLRASVFLAGGGVRPSNKEAGYVLRRLIRKILVYSIKYDIHADLFFLAAEVFKEQFSGTYPELKDSDLILAVLKEEELKFQSAIAKGIKELEKYDRISGKDAFYLYESFGLPFEIIKELAPKEAAKNLLKSDFDIEFDRHQRISRAGAVKKFGGHGLVLDTGELKAGNKDEKQKVIRLHTATHLLHQALRDVLGDEVSQRGSDITAQRARFDFAFPRKLTQEEIKKVEETVNDKIKRKLPVKSREMPKEEAEKTGALRFFKGQYPETVRVYYIGCPFEGAYSKEFCGGPHVSNTGEIGEFKITKEESSSAGVRRIRAIVL